MAIAPDDHGGGSSHRGKQITAFTRHHRFDRPGTLIRCAVLAMAALAAPPGALAACPAPQPPSSFCGDPACSRVICTAEDAWDCLYDTAGTACEAGTNRICDGTGACVARSFSCPVLPAAPPAGSNQQVGPANGEPGYCYFCGQADKYRKDRLTANINDGHTIPSYSNSTYSDTPFIRMDGTGYMTCLNRPDASTYGHAQEKAEIRGWVINTGSHANVDASRTSEDEWVMSVLVDIGWTPNTNEVYAVKSIDDLVQFITPGNLIEHAFAATVPARPYVPTPTFPPDAELGSSGAWGGVNAPVIHIEIDGWGRGRGDCDSTVVSTCDASLNDCDCSGWDYTAHAPAGWTRSVVNGSTYSGPSPCSMRIIISVFLRAPTSGPLARSGATQGTNLHQENRTRRRPPRSAGTTTALLMWAHRKCTTWTGWNRFSAILRSQCIPSLDMRCAHATTRSTRPVHSTTKSMT